MGPDDLAALFYGPDDDASAHAQALANALRGQQQAGLLGLLSGDKVLGGVGRQLLEGAQAQQETLPRAATLRLNKAIEAEKAKSEAARLMQEQQFRQAQEAHMQNQDAYQRALLAQGKFVQGPFGVLNTRTGQLDPYAKPSDGSKDQKQMEEQLGELSKALNRDAGRGSLLPQLQNRLNASERIKAAALNPDGTVKDLTPQLIAELATSTAALLANGTPGEHAIAALMPKGRGMKTAELTEWLTNNPQGAGQQAYVRAMVDLSNREEETIGEQIRSAQLRQLPRFAPDFKKYGAPFWNTAQSHIGKDVRTLVDPETLLALPPQAAAPAGWTPEKAKRLEEVRARLKALKGGGS